MKWMSLKRKLRTKYLGDRVPEILEATTWVYVKHDGVDVAMRYVRYRYINTKLPWYGRSKVMQGYQFADETAYPFAKGTATECMNTYVSLTKTVRGINEMTRKQNERYDNHQKLKAEMGIK